MENFKFFIRIPERMTEVPSVRQDTHILVTGVTGFVGAFILREILEITKATHIYCLVRVKKIIKNFTLISF